MLLEGAGTATASELDFGAGSTCVSVELRDFAASLACAPAGVPISTSPRATEPNANARSFHATTCCFRSCAYCSGLEPMRWNSSNAELIGATFAVRRGDLIAAKPSRSSRSLARGSKRFPRLYAAPSMPDPHAHPLVLTNRLNATRCGPFAEVASSAQQGFAAVGRYCLSNTALIGASRADSWTDVAHGPRHVQPTNGSSSEQQSGARTGPSTSREGPELTDQVI